MLLNWLLGHPVESIASGAVLTGPLHCVASLENTRERRLKMVS